MVSCVACGLSHNARKIGITFHRFPKKPELYEAWVKFVNKSTTSIPKFGVLCSLHFEDSEFDRSAFKVLLKPNAVPSKVIERRKYDKISSDEVTPSVSKEHGHSISSTASTSAEPMDVHQETLHSFDNPDRISEVCISTQKEVKLQQQIRHLSNMNLKQAQQIRQLQKRTWVQKKRIFQLTSALKELEKQNLVTSDQVSTIMGEFGENKDLITRLFRSTGRSVERRYRQDIRKFAITLHFFSPKAYNYVRERFHNCLPHSKTLSKWYSVVDAEPGITKETLIVLEDKCKLSEKKYICSLVFDEMAIREKIDFCGSKYYGFVEFGAEVTNNSEVANKALVFMLVCINDSWKVPVGYFFVNSVNSHQKAELLKQCVMAVQKCGIVISNITFDGCPTNFTMCSLLGADLWNINKLRPVVKIDNNEISVIPDPSHMVKLVRNCFGEKKNIVHGDGNVISFDYLERLVKLQETEGLCLANKLKKRHINFFMQKMKVKLATQLFSRSVADALCFCKEVLHLSEFQNVDATVEFITIINDAFDILNSHKLSAWDFKKAVCKDNIDAITSFILRFLAYIQKLKLSANFAL